MKIKHLVLEIHNVEKVASFYADILQLPVTENENSCTVTIGYSTIRFERSTTGKEPYYHFAFNIPSLKIEEAKEWLLSRVELLWLDDYKDVIADFKNWNAKSVYFFDVAGNVVEFISRTDLGVHKNDPFSSRQLLSVSELGLVFPAWELETRTENLLKDFSLSYFPKQAPLPQFKAVGDEEGLFIIVSENRNWYPTTKPALNAPVRVLFDTDGRDREASF